MIAGELKILPSSAATFRIAKRVVHVGDHLNIGELVKVSKKIFEIVFVVVENSARASYKERQVWSRMTWE